MGTPLHFREVDGILYAPDESFDHFVSPADALDYLSNRKRAHVLQNRVHYALSDYLSGKQPQNLETAASLLAEFNVKVDSIDPLSIITAYYRHECGIIPTGGEIVRTHPKPFEITDYDMNYLEQEVCKLVSAVRELDDYLAGAYLHGSFGDRGYVRNYSDVDILLVVDSDIATEADMLVRLRESLSKLRSHYYYIDPHQHHGPMIIAEQDLRCYNQTFLPPVALSRGRYMLNTNSLTAWVRDDELERIHGFWRVLQTLRRTVVEGKFPSRFGGMVLNAQQSGPLYCLKHFTSLVMLLPSLYATAIGAPVYKSESFNLPVLSKVDGSGIIDRCSAVRSAYPEAVSFDRSDRYRAALRSDPELARCQMQNIEVPRRLWKILGKDYFEAAHGLAEELWIQI